MGRTNGLKDRDSGHIGAIVIDYTSFCTIGPPAERQYAVDPLGVEIIKPSETSNKTNNTAN